MSELEYKISMLGPTRVGKTSLVASILGSTRDEILVGTSLNLKPLDLATEKKLSNHLKELKSSLNAGSFNSGAVAGTQEPSNFRFSLKKGAENKLLNFSLLDFPGGWIDPLNRPEQRQQDWVNCEQFIHGSSVLIIPVESPVLMEATTPEQKKAIEHNIHSEEIKNIVMDWAKFRNSEHANEPSTIIFAPVKCESYFTDNGFTSNKDKSEELQLLVENYYSDVIKVAKKEFEKNSNTPLSIIYIAVDTIGCVEIINGQWLKDDGYDFLRFNADYSIRKKSEIHRKGGEDIFIALFKSLLKAQEICQQSELKSTAQKLSNTEQDAKNSKNQENLWDNLVTLIGSDTERTRKTSRLNEQVAEIKNEKNEQSEKIQILQEIIKEIGDKPFSSRTTILI